MLDRRENVEPCHSNTCQWILELEKYQSWSSKPRGLLWIKGKPGAGKSTLMAFLHDKLKSSQNDDQGIQLDFFFSARGTDMQRTPLGMLRSLLNQIFDRDVTVRPQVREAYEQRSRQFGYGEGKWEWPQVVLEELLAVAILASASRQRVTVFVDALDETGAESAQKLAGYFHRLIDRAEKKNAAIRICISCRHYPIVGSAQTMEIHVEQHNHNDIATYITDILAETELEDSPSEDIGPVLLEKLIQQANGVFQWACLIMPLARQRILEGESLDDIRFWLREVPAGLEEVYMYILNDVIEVQNLKQSFVLFQWVCLAERPLTVMEMRYALAAENAEVTCAPKAWEKIHGFVESDERMKRKIKAISGGLVEVVSNWASDETVQVVHQSVNDFLRAKGLAALSDNIGASSSVLEEANILLQCQADLYRHCLVYLASLRIEGYTSSDPQVRRDELIRSHPLLAYATINLFIHAEKSANARVLMILDEQDILQQVIDQWVQIYRILDPHNPACPSENIAIIHMAAAANLVDLMERVSLNSDDMARKDGDGNTALHLAARYGHKTGARILREKGADCEAKNRRGNTPLSEAASYGHATLVEWLLHEGANIEGTMGTDGSVLQAASLGGHQNIVGILLGAGAEVNEQGGEYGNALQAAAYGESSGIVQMLLDAGADVNAQAGKYGNALQAAVYSGSSEIVQMLLDAGADVNSQGGEYGNALQAAVYSGSSEIVQMLLDAGADVDAQGGKYGNALQAAAYEEDYQIVAILLEASADINIQGGEYGNALQATAYRKSELILQMLLVAGADVNAQGGKYGNALQAAAYSESSEIVQMLLEAGADVNAEGGEYGNALQAAAYRKNSEIIQMLLDASADVNAQGGKYSNPLQAAICRAWDKSAKVVEMLLIAGADINAPRSEYSNALQAAAFWGSVEIVQLLLAVGADINAQSGQHGNALEIAICSDRSEIVQIFLYAGADVNAQSGQYGNVLQVAVCWGSSEVVQMLLDAGADVNARIDINVNGGKYGNALQAAVDRERRDIIQILLDAGAEVNAEGGEHSNALQAAIWTNRSEIVQILLDAGANINAPGGKYGNTLKAAIYTRNRVIVQMLIDAGADVNARIDINVAGTEYDNALQVAIYCENSEIVQMLLDAGADVNAQGGKYGNALQAAVNTESSEIVQMLLDAGADVHTQGGQYGNALRAAICHDYRQPVSYQKRGEILQMLLDAGADIDPQGSGYGDVLQAATYNASRYPASYGKSSQVVQVLLDAGADMNAQGGEFGNALCIAAYWESSEIVQVLLDAGADPNAQGGEYGNSLQAAICNDDGQSAPYGRSTEVVRMLLNAGADVNARGGRYGSSILAAIHQGKADQVQTLLHAGANPWLANELDQTPLHIAASKNEVSFLQQFPDLLCSINVRDKLLQTPLHLAICLGHIDFATRLFHLDANPSLRDGYGRNILDWVNGNESLMHQIQTHFPSIVATPDSAQELAVRQSILHISDTLLQSQLHFPWPLVNQLGRYLLFIGDLDNAQYLFQLHLSQDTFIGTPSYKPDCDSCRQPIDGSRFVCKTCAHVDLCSHCVQNYPFHSPLHPNQKHETFEVSLVLDEKFVSTASTSETLRNLLEELSASNTHGSGKGPSHDSVACLPSTVTVPKRTAVTSMALLGPSSTFWLLSFGLMAVSLTYWYTLI
ncbi:hypothetical protein N7457_007945 [Penicillium paradoxum]|uniref:uncharacterized protein n=1 Tax=Penicillium paradoxum TaxID=176176 RepID=UPI00254889E2|nr:uncharacterized protein N7457_007945 [Penicillium paradoxum]KAJ5773049.1 hypothetical protein N7457_007945 [Penicillium paradoxum]